MSITNLNNLLVTVFFTSVISQAVILIVQTLKLKGDIEAKRKLILADLRNQLKVLDRMHNKLQELDKKFAERDENGITNYRVDAFQDLQIDIYESVAKHEIHSGFGEKIFMVVDIYKSINFLKEHHPGKIHKDYSNRIQRHLEEKKGSCRFSHFCEAHLKYIDNARSNINGNSNTIKELKQQIGSVLLNKK